MRKKYERPYEIERQIIAEQKSRAFALPLKKEEKDFALFGQTYVLPVVLKSASNFPESGCYLLFNNTKQPEIAKVSLCFIYKGTKKSKKTGKLKEVYKVETLYETLTSSFPSELERTSTYLEKPLSFILTYFNGMQQEVTRRLLEKFLGEVLNS